MAADCHNEGRLVMARKDALKKLKDVLVRRRDALRKALAGDLSQLRELRDQGPGDVLDAAVDTAQDELNSQLLEVESRELEQIEEALDRLKTGTFGLCEVCEKPIPLKRLQALPYATECISCKRKSETGGAAVQTPWNRVFDNNQVDSV